MKNKNCAYTASANWIMRIVLAVIFLTAGYSKLAIMGVDNFSQALNIPIYTAWLVVLGEIGAGIGIIVGGLIGKFDKKAILTKFSGAIIVVLMIGAIVVAKLTNFDNGLIVGLQGMFDVLALTSMGLFFVLTGNSHKDMCNK